MPEDDMLGATLAAATQIVPDAAVAAAPGNDDRSLAARCASGDTTVFEQIYRMHGERMKSIAYNRLGNISDAEDAVQETFLKIHRAASTFTGEASFSTWMVRILINTCYDALRKRQRHPEDQESEGSFERTAANVDDNKRIALRKILDSLPEQRRTVFSLFEIEGLSHAEIGGILGISEANSKWILFSTKKQLQELWKKR
jgi:RNA polymerase sigma factor (sigma-70 family)